MSKHDAADQLTRMKVMEQGIQEQAAITDLAEGNAQRLVRLAALEEHKRLIEPYTDGLPYDKDRVIAAAKERLYASFMGAVECGKYLIWLQAEEGVQALGLTLANHFPEISRATAFNFMRLAKIAVEHPKMAMLAEKQRSKAIALLEILNEDDVGCLENGGIVAGMKLEEVDKIPWRQLKEKLRLYKKRIDRGEEQLVKLEEENKSLKKTLSDDRRRIYGDVIAEFGPEDEAAVEKLHSAFDHISVAFTMIETVDKEKTSDRLMMIARDFSLHIRQLAVETYSNIMAARPDLPDEGETNYWEERLPFNCHYTEKVLQKAAAKENGRKNSQKDA